MVQIARIRRAGNSGDHKLGDQAKGSIGGEGAEN